LFGFSVSTAKIGKNQEKYKRLYKLYSTVSTNPLADSTGIITRQVDGICGKFVFLPKF
jgi:hypothetical protein